MRGTMGRSLAVFGCLCALAALAQSAAVPTQDTMVVAKSDDTITTTPSIEELTTEESSPPIKLTEMEVISEVSLRYAHTTIVARMRNPAKRAQETSFRVLLPETAYISGFIMTLNGKSYKAYVKEKEEAKQIYQSAVEEGIGAAHISAKARDSNHFTVSANVEASSNAIFNLTYEELLFRRNGVYNHAINLHPGALVPKLKVTVHIKESEKITYLNVPEIRTGNEIDATKDDAQNSKVAIVNSHDDRETTIVFTPDLQEQERLIQIYAQKSKESATNIDVSATPEGVLGQFVVQYDVSRPKDGEILVNDGYFVHFFAPKELQPLNKFVVFVLDTSGSMMGRKITQLREALQTILGELNEGDYFSLVEFASSVTVHDLKEAEGEPPKQQYYYGEKETTLVPPSQATKENIERAKQIVGWLSAMGGTNIDKALDVAVQLINKGVDWTPTTTDNPSNVPEVPKITKSLEPMIIFLTDGDPTVGVTNPTRIISHVQEKNSGPNKATIFSLAFGEDADRKFLRKVSLRNGGFMRHIYEAADAALQLRDFYRHISSPLLSHVKFTYPPGQVKSESMTQNAFRTYFAGSELVVAGRVQDDATELAPTVSGFCNMRNSNATMPYEILPKVPILEKKKQGYAPLERLWSYLTIKQLLDQRDASQDIDDQDKENSLEKKALDLALKYEFVTPLTSLVVVKPNDTRTVNAESVDKTAGPSAFSSALNVPRSSFMRFGPSTGRKVPLSISHHRKAISPARWYSLHGLDALQTPEYYSNSRFHNLNLDMLSTQDTRGIVKHLLKPGPVMSQLLPDFMEEAEIDEYVLEDVDSAIALTTPVPHSTSRPSLPDSKLQAYTWMEPLLDASASAIMLTANDTTVILKLDSSVPREPSGDAKCPSAVDGGEGVCVYLTRCASSRDLTVSVYRTTYCTVGQGYAGVCCQQNKVDLIH